MLKLADFYHLPEVAALIAQLATDQAGLVIVAGLDPRPSAGIAVPPSGRHAMLRILAGEILAAHPAARAIVVAEDESALRVPRQMRQRVGVWRVREYLDYAERITQAAWQRPDLLVVDRLDTATIAPILNAARQGVRVLAQLDTALRGADVVQMLREEGATAEQLAVIRWIIAVQRVAALCPHCRRPASGDTRLLQRLQRAAAEHLGTVIPWHDIPLVAPGCDACNGSGRQGEITLFDVYQAGESLLSVLPMEAYALRLAALAMVPPEDALTIDAAQLRRTCSLFNASEQAQNDINAELQRKLVELEAANRALEHRTAALISLQDMAQTLAASNNLADLARRICRYAGELCGADRVALYLAHNDGAEVLAVSGWEPAVVGRHLPVADLASSADLREPQPYTGWPPGIDRMHPDVAGFALRAGLRIPLVAEDRLVGMMLVQSTHHARFAPAETALLRSFAAQAALSMQRATLIERLRATIAELETAQAALLAKERLEREMELAREVQQSVLPRTFPALAGYAFAARNRPARQVGGDFYDVFALGDDRIGLVIGDVSGKGMPAALYMALARSLILAEARREPSPRATLGNVNRLLRELGDPRMFVTVFYGVLDGYARHMTYCRAGHDYPLLLRDGAAHQLTAPGTFLGFLETRELRLEEESVILAPGDRLILYTDGLTDAQTAARELFGIERLCNLALSLTPHDPHAIVTETFAALDSYTGAAEQYDDMTMLVVAVEER
ncbi:MAG: SpoIIE family protein phosphatase [Chloroflexi bacterium]|nr:SpoIIE family protein phosphatase [Chloroflexota bacterium]